MKVRDLRPADDAWKLATLDRVWGGTRVARRGELVDAAPLPGVVAVDDDRDAADQIGMLTYAHRDDDVEVVTIHAEREGQGVGRALMDAVLDRALELGAARLWLRTTNDNVRALAFYQRWGMDLVALDRDAVTRARRDLKPQIPELGAGGVPLRHELELERRLR